MDDWWNNGVVVAVVAVALAQGATSLRNWKKKRDEMQKVLTREAFKDLFETSILPDLERTIKNMVEEQIRARVHARALKNHKHPWE